MATVAVLVDLQRVAVHRVDRTLFDGLSLTVSDGDRLGIVGVNGTGKSTLLRIASGQDRPDEGEVRFGRGARVAVVDQEPELPPGSVRAAVGVGWEADAALERLGMGAYADADVATLSGGQAKRVALARALAHPAELLILDEPTNHLDLGAVAWLEQRLLEFRGGLILVTHDRHLLDAVTTRMLELDRGKSYVHEGGYASYLEAKAEREVHAASAEASRQNLARRELAWLRRGAQARSTKPRARVEAAKELLERRPDAPAREGDLDLSVEIPRLGDLVIELHQVHFRYSADSREILAGIDLGLDRRERLGIVGANGTGKSTLVDLLAGRQVPTMGSVETGPSVKIGYYDQHGAELDLDARVQDLVAGPHRTPGSLADVALMRRFWFTGDLPYARVGSLSGGERRRLQLLLVIAERPNVLFLDEPTNDLDIDTLRIVEEFAEEWPGALVVVSHDRSFLERTTTRLVSVEADGSVLPVVGGLDAWIARSTAPPPRPGALDGVVKVAKPRPARPDGATLGRLLRDAEKQMVRAQKRRDALSEELAALSDHVELARRAAEMSEAQAALQEAEERWLTLMEEAEDG